MQSPCLEALHPPFAAEYDAVAASNFAANASSLQMEQPWVCQNAGSIGSVLTWTVGRDGTFTARLGAADNYRWLAGCSLPRRAAAAMLRTTRLFNPVTCFLAPFHAAAVRVLLDSLSPEQAVIAVVPEPIDMAFFLRCADFSLDIAAHRLWIVGGKSWSIQLEQLLLDQPGLAVPSQFLRLNVTDDSLIQRLIETAQSSFGRVVNSRTQRLASLHSEIQVRISPRLCVMTPMRFQLWEDEGFALSTAAPIDAMRLDTGDPANASPLRLAEAAIQAGNLLTPNIARVDMPGVVPLEVPWLSWITNTRVPAFSSAGPRDQLLIADPQLLQTARQSGWPVQQTHLAQWPPCVRGGATRSADKSVAVLANTRSLVPPEELDRLSSHRVLWETLREEIAANPLRVLIRGPENYLADSQQQFDVDSTDFPGDLFLSHLILPAYAQAIVASLLAANIPMRLFGDGWDQIEPFAPFAAGSLHTRQAVIQAATQSKAIVHVWPIARVHPFQALNTPTIRPAAASNGCRDIRFETIAPIAVQQPLSEAIRLVLKVL